MPGNNIVPAQIVGQPVATAEAVAYRVVNAVSPTVTTEQIEGGAVITVTDLHGTHSVTLYNGADGRGLANAVLNADYTLTLTFTDGTIYTTPSIRGADGKGIVSITKIGSSGLVDAYMITYSDGDPTMFYVTNGEDGISPTVEVAPITGGFRITFTDKNGPHSVDLMNGVNGISPDVTIESITGGSRVTITDAEHPAGQSFDVMDGAQGPSGAMTVETVTGSTPSITAVDNHMYKCGEVATITIVPPVTGICAVRFTSGTTPAVLTCSATWPDGFDATALEANTIYEINVMDGLALVAIWAVST